MLDFYYRLAESLFTVYSSIYLRNIRRRIEWPNMTNQCITKVTQFSILECLLDRVICLSSQWWRKDERQPTESTEWRDFTRLRDVWRRIVNVCVCHSVASSQIYSLNFLLANSISYVSLVSYQLFAHEDERQTVCLPGV